MASHLNSKLNSKNYLSSNKVKYWQYAILVSVSGLRGLSC